MKQHEPPTIKLTFLKRKSLLALIDNSIKGGDNYLFRNLYAKDEHGNELDILRNGNLSCAVFVSALLLNLELIKKPHSTVSGTEKDLFESGWKETRELKPGTVLIWEKVVFEDNTKHRHIGFYVGNNEAVSNNAEAGFPRRHDVTYNGSRRVEKIYWHPDLDKG